MLTQHTHVVGDALNLLTFHKDDPFSCIAAQLNAQFDIGPSDIIDLANEWTKKRPDLLIGAIDWSQGTLNVVGGLTALDPRSSCILKHAISVLGLTACSRTLLHIGRWSTPESEMYGGVPPTLYHGTSDVYLTAIKTNGLITRGKRNWKIGGRDHVYLTATAQVAAFHAQRTAELRGGNPIVVECKRPSYLVPDWDVKRSLVKNKLVPSRDGRTLARESGLFASPHSIANSSIIRILTYQGGKHVTEPAIMLPPYDQWSVM